MSFDTDPINVEGATASCKDCKKTFTDTLVIKLSDWMWGGAMASGDLFFTCADHHDENRKWGDEEGPQHSEFTITKGKRMIGSFRVATMVTEVSITVQDNEINNKLSDQASLIRREHGF